MGIIVADPAIQARVEHIRNTRLIYYREAASQGSLQVALGNYGIGSSKDGHARGLKDTNWHQPGVLPIYAQSGDNTKAWWIVALDLKMQGVSEKGIRDGHFSLNIGDRMDVVCPLVLLERGALIWPLGTGQPVYPYMTFRPEIYLGEATTEPAEFELYLWITTEGTGVADIQTKDPPPETQDRKRRGFWDWALGNQVMTRQKPVSAKKEQA